VRTSRALSKLLRPVVPALVANPLARAAFFAQYTAHPVAVDPAVAIEDIDALIGATAFDDVCDAFTGYIAPADAADRVPVTIAWGDKDRLLLPRQARRARRLLPRARVVIVPGTGHLMMGDDPSAVAAVVREATRAPAPAPVPA
jgi:pimeloyl-ACP methyl ester carboxylesterase